MTNTIIASQTNSGLKNFIIGKMWVNSLDGVRPGSIKISRDLPGDITLNPGSTLFLSVNKKREGKQDADYSISVLVPVATADELIKAEQELIAKRKADSTPSDEPETV